MKGSLTKKLKTPPRPAAKKPVRPASKNGHAATQAAGTNPKRVRAILQKLDEAYPRPLAPSFTTIPFNC